MDFLQQAEIEWQCKKLSEALAYHLDHRRYEDLVALFTPDGVFDRIGHVSHGRADLLAALKARAAGMTTRHFTTNFHFTRVDETSAEAIYYSMTSSGDAGDEKAPPVNFRFSQASFMEFHDSYVKTEEGWRIKARIATLAMVPEDYPIQAGQNALSVEPVPPR